MPSMFQTLRRAPPDFSSLHANGPSRGRKSLPAQIRAQGSELAGDLTEVTQPSRSRATLTPVHSLPSRPAPLAPRDPVPLLKVFF